VNDWMEGISDFYRDTFARMQSRAESCEARFESLRLDEIDWKKERKQLRADLAAAIKERDEWVELYTDLLRAMVVCGKETSSPATTTTTKTPIERCDMNVRARKALRSLGVLFIEDAQQLAPHDIRALKNVGETTVMEIRNALGERGLALRGCWECGDATQKEGGGA
jgi:DNA-directed RNA polymerase alpha subunit